MAEVDRHGPLRHRVLPLLGLTPLTSAGLADRMKSALSDPGVSGTPSREQTGPVRSWMDAVVKGGQAVFLLDPGGREDALDETSFLWTVFHEFISVVPARDEITVAVVGYD